jgi:hypothetical protein
MRGSRVQRRDSSSSCLDTNVTGILAASLLDLPGGRLTSKYERVSPVILTSANIRPAFSALISRHVQDPS